MPSTNKKIVFGYAHVGGVSKILIYPFLKIREYLKLLFSNCAGYTQALADKVSAESNGTNINVVKYGYEDLILTFKKTRGYFRRKV